MSQGQRVLVVEDEEKIVSLLKGYLEREGYQVISAGDGRDALDKVARESPDLVLLDLNLPGMDGLAVCREIRRQGNLPIIMLTARVEELDRVLGLELGADDYIPKPFSPREVVARVKAVLRRTPGGDKAKGVLTFGDLAIDPQRYEVKWMGKLIGLTPREFRLLEAMAREPGRVFTRLQLLERAWGDAYEGYERSVDAHIKNLRRKLEEDPQNPRYIVTVFGVGYKFQG